MTSLFERMGGTYRREGDYFIPDIELPDAGTAPLGKYGRMRRRYLQENHPGLYARLTASGKLYEHLTEIDQTCHERMGRICIAMAAREGVTEALKADDQMEWVRRMNNIRSRAEETVTTELIYTEERGV